MVAMWRLKHRIFGWHYVYMESSTGILNMVRRVLVTASGERYVKGYGEGFVFIDRPDRWTITPLTWTEPTPDADMRTINPDCKIYAVK